MAALEREACASPPSVSPAALDTERRARDSASQECHPRPSRKWRNTPPCDRETSDACLACLPFAMGRGTLMP
jgi:hypothetical protein